MTFFMDFPLAVSYLLICTSMICMPPQMQKDYSKKVAQLLASWHGCCATVL